MIILAVTGNVPAAQAWTGDAEREAKGAPSLTAAEKQRRFRERDRKGVRVYRFPLGPDDLDFFVRARWIDDAWTGDHDAVVAAVLARLRELYRNR